MSNYWKDLLERTTRTFVQGFLAVATLAAVTDVDANVQQVALGGLIAGAYAVLTAFVAAGVGNKDSAGFTT